MRDETARYFELIFCDYQSDVIIYNVRTELSLVERKINLLSLSFPFFSLARHSSAKLLSNFPRA